MTLSHSDVRRILAILDSAEHLDSLDVTVGKFELHARKHGGSAAMPGSGPRAAVASGPDVDAATEVAATPGTAAGTAPLVEVPAGLVAVRAPMVGTFYLRPSPDQPPFVTVGGTVQSGETVCLVEVMKMFNTVKTEVAGTVERILVGNGQPVHHDQIVMLIKPVQEV